MTDQRFMHLRQVLADSFSEEELRTLCFDLGVNYDALPATGTAGKVREIILDLGKQGRLTELVAYVRQARPALAVDDLPPSITVTNIYEAVPVLPRPGSAPPLPSLVLGREEALRDLKVRLGIAAKGQASTPVKS